MNQSNAQKISVGPALRFSIVDGGIWDLGTVVNKHIIWIINRVGANRDWSLLVLNDASINI